MPTVLLESALNLVFPPLCRCCEEVLPGDHRQLLCTSCESKLQLLPEPCCQRCGAPIDGDEPPLFRGKVTPRCDHCPNFPVHFEKAASAVEYAPPFRELIHHFKFRGSRRVRPILLEWFLKGAEKRLRSSDFDAIVTVPLHWWRRFQREFNQAEVLGLALANSWSLPILPKALRRRRATLPQSQLNGKWRERNIRDAFAPGREPVEGLRLLLVDDVMTTGATLSACAGVLDSAGAALVTGYTLARRL